MKKNSNIAESIIALKKKDLEFREKLVQKGQLGDGYNDDMALIHNQNAAALDEIINTIGYPTEEKVGEEASEAAWLVIQHSIARPDFMKKCAAFLEREVHLNKADPRHLALLLDRINVFEGRPQLYGTQFDWDESGSLSPNIYDNLIKVNARRKTIGLNTLEEQIKTIKENAKRENHLPPKDLEKRRRELENWKEKVGWTI